MHRLLTCLAAMASVTLSVTLSVAQSPLSTTFAGNNGGSTGGAVYFDLTVHTAVTILQIDINTTATTTGTLDVFTVPGGRAGQQGLPNNWIGPSVLGSPITTLGTNAPSPCVLQAPLPLLPGTYGVALVANGFPHRYTNGTGANQTATTLELTLDAGEASNQPFATPLFTRRVANVNLHYVPGSPGVLLSTATNYGAGCVGQTDTAFYEEFSAGTFDLTGSVNSMTLIHTASGYQAVSGFPGVGYVQPSATAQSLPLTNDSEVTVTLSTPMPTGFRSRTSTLQVCSNGFISTRSNGTPPHPTVQAMLHNAHTAWYCWHNYDPSVSGAVTFEEVAGIAYVTWDSVYSLGLGTTNTMQFQFDVSTGNVSMIWNAINASGTYLVGFCEGGATIDPGPTDLSLSLPNTIQNAAAFRIAPLTLTASSRPIANTVINLATSEMTPGTVFGGVFFGLQQLATPIDLSTLGMAGCFQYTSQEASVLFFPSGAGSAMLPITVPNLIGLTLHVQSASYDPFAGLTPLGAAASNAVELLIGDW